MLREWSPRIIKVLRPKNQRRGGPADESRFAFPILWHGHQPQTIHINIYLLSNTNTFRHFEIERDNA